MKKTRHMLRAIAVGVTLMTATECFATAPTTAQDTLLRLLDQYQLLRTLHVKATTATDYKTIPPGIFHVGGSQEYWVDGSNYRILQIIDSAVFSGMSHDVRWDGEHYQWLNGNDSTLIVSEVSKQKSAYIGEPIALLPSEFLNPSGEDLGVKLSIDDLRGDKVRSKCDDANFVDPNKTDVTIHGGCVGNIDTTYRLEFGGSPSYLPTTIRRVSSAGVELDTDEIRYRPVKCDGGTIYLPCWARMTDRTSDNRVVSVTVCNVTQIETNLTIPPETFTIDYQTAKRVIDIDHPTRHMSADAPPAADSKVHGQQVSLDTSIDSSATFTAAPTLVAQAPSTTSGQGLWAVAHGAMPIGLALLCAWAIVTYRNKVLSKDSDDNKQAESRD